VFCSPVPHSWLSSLAWVPMRSHKVNFQKLATDHGLSSLVASSVGPGPADSTQRFHGSFLYLGRTFDIGPIRADIDPTREWDSVDNLPED